MKRALLAVVLVVGCDDWGTLQRDAHCHARGDCDGGTGGGTAGGAAGGSAGGVAAGGQGGGGTADGGSVSDARIASVWKSGGMFTRAVAGEGDSVVVFFEPSGGGQSRIRFSSDGGVSPTQSAADVARSAYQLDGQLVVCGNTGRSGFATWLNPQTAATLGSRLALGFEVSACNVYPTDAGPTLAAWGVSDAGAELWVSTALRDGGLVGPIAAGSCEAGGSFSPSRIRYSPYRDRGVLSGQYGGNCTLLNRALNVAPAQPLVGFVGRAPNDAAAPPASGFTANGPVLSERHGDDHFLVARGNGSILVSRLLDGDNDPARQQGVIPMGTALPLREAVELVSMGPDAGMLLVGAARYGGQNGDRDVTVHRVSGSSSITIDELLQVDAGGDQEATGAVWLSGPRLLVVAGSCRALLDGGNVPPPSDLCTGDGGSAFVVFLDPSKF